jgi:hypothetical protein
MAKLGTEKRPVVVRVHTDEKAKYVADAWHNVGVHVCPKNSAELRTPPKLFVADRNDMSL